MEGRDKVAADDCPYDPAGNVVLGDMPADVFPEKNQTDRTVDGVAERDRRGRGLRPKVQHYDRHQDH